MGITGDSPESTPFFATDVQIDREIVWFRFLRSRQTHRGRGQAHAHYGATSHCPRATEEQPKLWERAAAYVSKKCCSLIVTVSICVAVLLTSAYFGVFRDWGYPWSSFPVPMKPDEIEWYRRSGVYWDTPRRLECLEQYHYREYVAQLQNVSLAKGFDVVKACEAIAVEIANQTFETPDKCMRRGIHMYGYWTVYDPLDCTIEDETERYRNSGMSWSVPEPAEHCHSYDKREYEAQLWDIPAGYSWYQACQYVPITIQGQVLEKPDSCERRGSGVFGKWIAGLQLDCRPYWGPLKDVGCQASGKKRFEAELWNLIKGDDWYEMCFSTPATWYGQYYAHPSACDYRRRGGMTGIWEEVSCQ